MEKGHGGDGGERGGIGVPWGNGGGSVGALKVCWGDPGGDRVVWGCPGGGYGCFQGVMGSSGGRGGANWVPPCDAGGALGEGGGGKEIYASVVVPGWGGCMPQLGTGVTLGGGVGGWGGTCITHLCGGAPRGGAHSRGPAGSRRGHGRSARGPQGGVPPSAPLGRGAARWGGNPPEPAPPGPPPHWGGILGGGMTQTRSYGGGISRLEL